MNTRVKEISTGIKPACSLNAAQAKAVKHTGTLTKTTTTASNAAINGRQSRCVPKQIMPMPSTTPISVATRTPSQSGKTAPSTASAARTKRSRPRLSVPKGCRSDGRASTSARLTLAPNQIDHGTQRSNAKTTTMRTLHARCQLSLTIRRQPLSQSLIAPSCK